MISWASIGFLVCGFLFLIYALTFHTLIARVNEKAKAFAYAFCSLSAAFFIWGIAVLSHDGSLLSASIILGDLCIIMATIFLFTLQLAAIKNGTTIAIAFGLLFELVFLWLRVQYFLPTPSFVNGILIFNTPLPISLLLGILLAGIWLPTNIMVARMITKKMHIARLSYLYGAVYSMTIVAALLFMASRTALTAVVSFIGIMLCFFMLLTSNVIAMKLLKVKKK